MTAVYSMNLVLPPGLVSGNGAYDSLDEALRMAGTLADGKADLLTELAKNAFDQAYLIVMISATVLVAVTLLVLKYALRPLTKKGSNMVNNSSS